MARPRIPMQEKLEASVVRVPESGCWIWMKSVNHRGYGRVGFGVGENFSAHRASYEQKYGPIPNGLMALHHCDVPSCINPDHIFLGTQQDNMTDKVAKKRQAVGEFHGMSKLTEQQAMRAKFGKEKPTELAKEFGCSAVIIRQIRQGKYWKYLER